MVLQRGKARIEKQLKPIEITGMSEQYWVETNQDGWSGATLFRPDVFSQIIGEGTVLAAVPAHGIVLYWRGGQPEVDKIVAVGVREIYASRQGAVSPVVFRWTGEDWVPFSEAVKRPEPKQKNPPR